MREKARGPVMIKGKTDALGKDAKTEALGETRGGGEGVARRTREGTWVAEVRCTARFRPRGPGRGENGATLPYDNDGPATKIRRRVSQGRRPQTLGGDSLSRALSQTRPGSSARVAATTVVNVNRVWRNGGW